MIKIKKLENEKDVSLLASIEREVHGDYFNEKDFTKWSNEGVIVISLDEDKIIGFIVITKPDFERFESERKWLEADGVDEDLYSITTVSLLKEYRGKGIGSQMMEYAINFMDKPTCLFAFIENKPAVNLYKKYDFKIVDTWITRAKKERCSMIRMPK
ncbi:MAG: GNAT family N-acetyltransferase [Mycoplasma sp.]|nr:GNAT family N-acetyltransferase [Mycoplasma sp.]